MFIKLTVVDVKPYSNDNKEIVTRKCYITLNSDCIEQYGMNGFRSRKDKSVVAEFTHIVLKDGSGVDVAERKVDIDALLDAHEVIEL